jgi:hypothetical protein
MATYSKVKLSNSTSGRPILIDTVNLTSAAITNVTASSGTITYTATHAFTAGQIVTISGVVSSTNTTGALNTGYNLANVPIASVTGTTSFTVTNAATGTYTSSTGTATANPASMNTIHATDTNATTIDEVWLYATNTSLAPVTLTLFYGGGPTVGSGAQNAPNYISIPPQSGLTLITPGLMLTGVAGSPGSATTIYASASVGSVITISGYVNRIV